MRFNKHKNLTKQTPETRVNQALYDQAKGSLSEEKIKEYEEMGEKMYNTIDFNTGTLLEPEKEIESVACLIEAIKSGLHPDYMSDDEKELLKKHYGENWLDELKTTLHIPL